MMEFDNANPNIKFTYEFCEESIKFLDLIVKCFNAGKNGLDPKCFTPLKCDIVCLNGFKKSTLFDEHCQIPLSPLDGLLPHVLSSAFQKSALKFGNLLTVLHWGRHALSPGTNMIPYEVYKKCPCIMLFLFKIFQHV